MTCLTVFILESTCAVHHPTPCTLPQAFSIICAFATFARPVMEKGCSDDGWHRISICASESMRLNTSPHTMHSRRHIGFVGRSPLVNIMTNNLPTLSSLILSNLLPIEVAPRGLCQQPPLRQRNSRWTLSSGDRRSPLKCYAVWQRWSATSPCGDLRPPAPD